MEVGGRRPAFGSNKKNIFLFFFFKDNDPKIPDFVLIRAGEMGIKASDVESEGIWKMEDAFTDSLSFVH